MEKTAIIGIIFLVAFIAISTFVSKRIEKIKRKAYEHGLHDAGENMNSFAFWLNGYPELGKCKYLLEFYAKWLMANKTTPTNFHELRGNLLNHPQPITE